jgi:predicted nucleic acid-binding protein
MSFFQVNMPKTFRYAFYKITHMRVYIDTNVILDLFLRTNTEYVSPADIACQIFYRSSCCEFYCVISDLTLFELKKKISAKQVDDFLDFLGIKYEPVCIIKEDYQNPFKIHRPDDVHIACAVRVDCDCILTNDLEFLEVSPIPVRSSRLF